MQEMRFPLALILLLLVCSCGDNDSGDYQKEEIEVYNAMIDEFLDSLGFETSDSARLVFYVSDTLAAEEDWEASDDLLSSDLPTIKFSIDELNKNSSHKFIRATDTLRLDSGDHFTRRWIGLTRVRFNKDRTKGFLRVRVWCGDLCSWTHSFDIKKENGRWIVTGITKGPVA